MHKSLPALLSVLVGLCTLMKTQDIVKDMEPIVKQCKSGNMSLVQVPYEPLVAGGIGSEFICIITHFFHALVNSRGGYFIWATVFCIFVSGSTFALANSMRPNVHKVLQHPWTLYEIGQITGIGIIMPLVWAPLSIWSSETKSSRAAIGTPHFLIQWISNLYATILSVLCFTVDTNSYFWTCVAGMTGGPLLYLVSISNSFIPKPFAKFNSLVARSYQISFVSGTVVWWYSCYKLYRDFGFPLVLSTTFWTSNFGIHFMVWDTLGLFFAFWLVLLNESAYSALLAIFVTPVVGPGASLALGFLRSEKEKIKEE